MAYGKVVGFERLRHLACKVKDRVGLFPSLSSGPLCLKVVYIQPFHHGPVGPCFPRAISPCKGAAIFGPGCSSSVLLYVHRDRIDC